MPNEVANCRLANVSEVDTSDRFVRLDDHRESRRRAAAESGWHRCRNWPHRVGTRRYRSEHVVAVGQRVDRIDYDAKAIEQFNCDRWKSGLTKFAGTASVVVFEQGTSNGASCGVAEVDGVDVISGLDRQRLRR